MRVLWLLCLLGQPIAAQPVWSLEHRCGGGDETLPYGDTDPLPILVESISDQVAPELRRARARLFSNRSGGGRTLDQLAQPHDGPPGGHVMAHPPARPPFPVEESDVIVTGEVTSVQAYLSEDRRRFYTELGFRVSACVKGCGREFVIVQNEGARLRLPSGTLVSGRICGTGMQPLRAGRRYLLFLSHYEGAAAALIVKGWAIEHGRIRPMSVDDRARMYHGHPTLSGQSEPEALDTLRKEVAR